MKSCRNCRHYRCWIRLCTKKDLYIIDCLSGDKCSCYKEKRDLNNATVMCSKCKNLNKYSYCWKRKNVFLKKNKIKKENAFILKEVKGGKVHDQYIEVNKKS